MKSVIVPTDFSPSAINAMNYAADMALEIGASLFLLHVYQVPVAVTDTPLAFISIDELRDSADRQVQELKKGLEHITSGKLKVYAKSVLGDIMEEITTLCEEQQPFAVVMGTMGSSAVERTLFGSTTLKMVKHLTWPIISVPRGTEYGTGIRKVGMACDFREVVETTPVGAIRDFVRQFNAQFHVLNVDYDNNQRQPDTIEQSALFHSAMQDLHPQYHFIKGKDIEEGINEFAEKNNLDIVITIPKKHRLIEGLFKKSATRHLVFESHVPVLCIHE